MLGIAALCISDIEVGGNERSLNVVEAVRSVVKCCVDARGSYCVMTSRTRLVAVLLESVGSSSQKNFSVLSALSYILLFSSASRLPSCQKNGFISRSCLLVATMARAAKAACAATATFTVPDLG